VGGGAPQGILLPIANNPESSGIPATSSLDLEAGVAPILPPKRASVTERLASLRKQNEKERGEDDGGGGGGLQGVEEAQANSDSGSGGSGVRMSISQRVAAIRRSSESQGNNNGSQSPKRSLKATGTMMSTIDTHTTRECPTTPRGSVLKAGAAFAQLVAEGLNMEDGGVKSPENA